MADIVTVDLDELRDRLVAELPDEIELVYPHYDDRLTDEQVHELLREGEVPDTFDEWFSDAMHHGCVTWIDEHLDSDLERAAFQGTNQWYEVIDDLRERDVSDVLDAMLRSTPDLLLRYRLGNLADDVHVPQTVWMSEQEVFEQAESIIELMGLRPTGQALDAVNSALVNASYGGIPYILWRADIAQLNKALNAGHKTIWWENPYLLIHDGFNGSGDDEKIQARIVLPLERERIYVDSASWGYSWQTICGGLVASAYDCDWKTS